MNHWLIITALFSAITVFAVKHYILKANYFYLLVAILSETGLLYSYTHLLQGDDIFATFSVVKILGIILVFIPSVVLFDNKLTNRKIIGLILAVVSIYLLQ